MKTLALLLLLAAPTRGSVASSKVRLAAEDASGALRDAELAVERGGGADAYAARADAKRALGRPYDDYIADYAQAAKLDPRYEDKYEGVVEQMRSERSPAKSAGGFLVENDANILAKILGAVAVGSIIGIAALVLLRGRERALPPPKEEPSDKNPPRPS